MINQPKYLVLLFFFVTYSSFAQTDFKRFLSQNTKLEISYVETPPFISGGKDDIKGLCYGVMSDFKAYVGNQYGVDLNLDYRDPVMPLEMFSSVEGGTDGPMGVADIIITEDREKRFDFTEPYMKLELVLVTNSSVSTLVSMKSIAEQFSGFKAYAVPGTIGDRKIREIKREFIPDLEIVETSIESLLSDVAKDSKSFGYVGISNIFSNRELPLKYHPVANLEGSDVGFIGPKGSTWIALFNEFMNANGGYTNSENFKKVVVAALGEKGYKVLMSRQ